MLRAPGQSSPWRPATEIRRAGRSLRPVCRCAHGRVGNWRGRAEPVHVGCPVVAGSAGL